ncbi:hypothetical protein EDB89DRAFT_1955524 [Lactarius sanguifluus]|nr:hypothetical protein EDB89DRAFT_1955524 [Lactarius sanguifluus]
MAAAWLKLEAYDSAEECAQNALRLDPRFTRVRYRRGLARKGNLQLAAAVVDPDSTEARTALDETFKFALISESNNEEDESFAEDDLGPSLTDPGKGLESVSDPSDRNHGGNGFLCRNYNRDGCTRSVGCKFSHAPDHKSVRDRPGCNVCVYFLVRDADLTTYLPSGWWWDDEQKHGAIGLISKGLVRRQYPAFLHRLFANIDGRIASVHPSENMEMLQHDFGEEVDDDWLEKEHTTKRV